MQGYLEFRWCGPPSIQLINAYQKGVLDHGDHELEPLMVPFIECRAVWQH